MTQVDKKYKRQSMLFGFLIFVGVLLIIIAILASIKVVDYAEYTNKQHGVTMKYPVFWEKVDAPAAGALVVFRAPKMTELDLFLPNVNIAFVPIEKEIDSARFNEKVISQVTGTFRGHIKVLHTGPVRVAGRRGYSLSYIGHDDQNRDDYFKYLHRWVVVGKRAYILTYVAIEKDFDENLWIVKAMMKSFAIQ
ncbi:MAG: hypothetical protein KAJ18_01650 [Candidatus Omnitrophica bacterium]|nr:hypothetical protein [Candidatus Omnitrophota bacterium]